MILVTGATGFIGQHLVKQLVEAQYPVCSLIRPRRVNAVLRRAKTQLWPET
jgi:uncharacterized protein YbjT (DUF2867 family)